MPSNKPTAWVGWVYFASAMMVLVGGMQVIAGLVAIFNHTYYLVTQNGLVALNYTAWGWIHLLIGVLIVAAGFAVMSGKTWGIAVGVIMAILSALANLAFLSAYPVWSIILIAIDVAVIYALTMHGSELRE
jgi:hypothetical protein